MSKSSGVGVAVVALLVGGIALDWIAYTQLGSPGPQLEPPSVPRVQTIYHEDYVYTNPAGSYIDVPNFTISFTLGQGQRVLLTYSCEVAIDVSGGGSSFYAFFTVNGTTLQTTPDGWPIARETALAGSGTVFTHAGVSYSPPLNWLPAGTHTVTMRIRGTNATTFAYYHTLTVQVYAV
ncbi:MAG: hypothetical protein RBG13Loki_4304 [Promethearchaeota archaeon CR_4]|nr:MAG: hypothetical protein RBG13Loki_4304 [Candidatus Lokiarchaeota archaeon CR_4]